MRGEQSGRLSRLSASLGSPPLARGTVHSLIRAFALRGITPACAGNSVIQGKAYQYPGDHPRLRGEQGEGQKESPPREGSPPLARGTVPAVSIVFLRQGITPACAGNSAATCRRLSSVGDHPRLRGEQHLRASSSGFQLGSPPLARGTARAAALCPCACGITPACAGNSRYHKFRA